MTIDSTPRGDSGLEMPLPDLYEASIAELQDGLQNKAFTSVDLVKVRNLE